MKLNSFSLPKSKRLIYAAFILSLQICLLFSKSSLAETYTIDPEHSRLEFKVKHMGIGWVSGRFREFSGTFVYDPKDLTKSNVDVSINTVSIESGALKRDKHLISADFLDALAYRQMHFLANKIEGSDPENFKITGILTIKEIQREATLNVTHGGSLVDPWGVPRSAFHATTKINRKDFGLRWNRILESGAFLVGEEVEISMDIQGLVLKDTTPKLKDPS